MSAIVGIDARVDYATNLTTPVVHTVYGKKRVFY